jgi:SAM-dependent methyltransferase
VEANPLNHSTLLDDPSLCRSEIVANAAMNRERGIAGPNSYAQDLGFDVLDYLRECVARQGRAAWLDLCCGYGRALIEAGGTLSAAGTAGEVAIRGVDLIPMFYPVPPELTGVRLEAASLADWEPERAYDLITCVHGLHYLGDKLGLVTRALRWLTAEGRFVAHLDPANLRTAEGTPAGPAILKHLRGAGLTFNPGRKLLAGVGRRELRLPFRYLGADDTAGPNYTGQAAVHSWYGVESAGSG